jgi:D-serine deaminase-like pyridoxal phosphate-dependent protein
MAVRHIGRAAILHPGRNGGGTGVRDARQKAHRNALTVVATVVSVPTADRAIIDAGSKTVTSVLMGQTDYGHIREYPEIRIVGLSEEHGHLDMRKSVARPKIGERITIIPNHACVASNLHDRVYVHDGDGVLDILRVDCRGSVV